MFTSAHLLSSTVLWQGVNSLVYRVRLRTFLMAQPLALLASLPLEAGLCRDSCAAYTVESKVSATAATPHNPHTHPTRYAAGGERSAASHVAVRNALGLHRSLAPRLRPLPWPPRPATCQAFVRLLEGVRLAMSLPLALPQHAAANAAPASPLASCIKLQAFLLAALGYVVPGGPSAPAALQLTAGTWACGGRASGVFRGGGHMAAPSAGGEAPLAAGLPPPSTPGHCSCSHVRAGARQQEKVPAAAAARQQWQQRRGCGLGPGGGPGRCCGRPTSAPSGDGAGGAGAGAD